MKHYLNVKLATDYSTETAIFVDLLAKLTFHPLSFALTPKALIYYPELKDLALISEHKE